MKLKNLVITNKTIRFLLKFVLIFIVFLFFISLYQKDIKFSYQKLFFAAIFTGIGLLYSILYDFKIVSVKNYMERSLAYKIMVYSRGIYVYHTRYWYKKNRKFLKKVRLSDRYNNLLYVSHKKDKDGENANITQQNFQLSDIVGKKWKGSLGVSYSFFLEFNSNEKITYIEEFSPNALLSEYYLSDNIETTFDVSQVGENSRGKYIIARNKLYENDIYVYEILSLTNDRLVLKDLQEFYIQMFSTKEMSVLHKEIWDKSEFENENIKQQTFQLSDIAGKEWKLKTSANYYTSSGYMESEYYLSDSIDTAFDKSKVGKNTSGRYIIGRNSNGNIDAYEILRVSYDRLILKEIDCLYGHGIIPLHLVEE